MTKERKSLYSIKCKDMNLETSTMATSEANAAHIFADNHFASFYPPYQIDGMWHVQNAVVVHRFKVVDAGVEEALNGRR